MEVIGLHDNRRQDDPCALKHRDISPGGITIHFDSIRRILVWSFLLLAWRAADTALAFQLPPAPFNAIPVGDSPFALALSPDNGQAVVVNLFPTRNPDGSPTPACSGNPVGRDCIEGL